LLIILPFAFLLLTFWKVIFQMSRLAQLGQAKFKAKVEKKFHAGSNPAPCTTKILCKVGGIGRRTCFIRQAKLSNLDYSKKLKIFGWIHLNLSIQINRCYEFKSRSTLFQTFMRG
jgi:hypothetical protein